MKHALPFAWLVAPFALTLPATADTEIVPQLIPMAQERSVFGLTIAANPDVSLTTDESAPPPTGFGPIAEEVQLSIELPGVVSEGGGTQYSEIRNRAIYLRGSAFGEADVSGFDASAICAGQSVCEFTFRPRFTTVFTLSGRVSESGDASTEYSLTEDTGLVVLRGDASGTTQSVKERGVLEAGRGYTLRVDASGTVRTTNSPIHSSLAKYDLTLMVGDEPGSGFCFGERGCPCMNNDFSGLRGCANSSGFGSHLTGWGSTSISANTFGLRASGLTTGESGLFYMGETTFDPITVDDGIACTGGLFRFLPTTVDENGDLCMGEIIAAAPEIQIVPGETRFFQAWARDVLCGPPPLPCPSPCGGNSNTSNGYAVTFSP